MKKIIGLILLAATILAEDIKVTVTLTDTDQKAMSIRQAREGDTNTVSDYALALFNKSRTNITQQEIAGTLDVIKSKYATADAATKASVQAALGVQAKDVIPEDSK